ncbi:hypothetical protein [Streptomyces sp. YIM S03343]
MRLLLARVVVYFVLALAFFERSAVFGPDDVGELAYARRLLGHLDASMLLLADAYYDAFDFLQAVQDTGARFVLRSTRKRRPTVRRPLPDGSYLTAVLPRRHRARASGQQVEARVVEAWLTVVLADGTQRTELWRLLTNLLEATRQTRLAAALPPALAGGDLLFLAEVHDLGRASSAFTQCPRS